MVSSQKVDYTFLRWGSLPFECVDEIVKPGTRIKVMEHLLYSVVRSLSCMCVKGSLKKSPK